MKDFSDQEKKIIKKIIYLDDSPATFNVINNIIEDIFDFNFFIKLESDVYCPLLVNKDYFDKMTNEYGSMWINEFTKDLTKSLFLLIGLLKYLERENLIILSGEFDVKYLGVPDTIGQKLEYQLEDKSLIKDIYLYSRKRIIATESLRTLLKNDYKSIQEIQIINELRYNKKLLKWTIFGVAIAGISFLGSFIFQLFMSPSEVRLTNDELKLRIINEAEEDLNIPDSIYNKIIVRDSIKNENDSLHCD
jgi:hypothetical protein